MSIGFWVGIGSRDESGALAGASHFLEHLLFKGTDERSARDIAVAVDAVGGEMNAFTSREHTATTPGCRPRELGFGLDLLVDVVGGRRSGREVDAEREVILEEILMNEDTPDDVVHTRLHGGALPRPPPRPRDARLEETITGMGRDDIAGFHDRWYRPTNLVVAAAGDLDHDEVVDDVAACLADVEPGTRPERSAPAAALASFTWSTDRPSRPTSPWPGADLHYDDPDRYALLVANHVLGGGMSSRLFQEVREERGLAYTRVLVAVVLRRRRGVHALRRHRAEPGSTSSSTWSTT